MTRGRALALALLTAQCHAAGGSGPGFAPRHSSGRSGRVRRLPLRRHPELLRRRARRAACGQGPRLALRRPASARQAAPDPHAGHVHLRSGRAAEGRGPAPPVLPAGGLLRAASGLRGPDQRRGHAGEGASTSSTKERRLRLRSVRVAELRTEIRHRSCRLARQSWAEFERDAHRRPRPALRGDRSRRRENPNARHGSASAVIPSPPCVQRGRWTRSRGGRRGHLAANPGPRSRIGRDHRRGQRVGERPGGAAGAALPDRRLVFLGRARVAGRKRLQTVDLLSRRRGGRRLAAGPRLDPRRSHPGRRRPRPG